MWNIREFVKNKWYIIYLINLKLKIKRVLYKMGDDVAAANTMSGTKTVGCVKWFNNKQGFGFLTMTTGEHSGEDVFVHHSGIKVSEEQYRYLVQGEYVEFDLVESETEDHKWHASEIGGMNGGKLMCETRNLVRKERMKHTDEQSGQQGGGSNRTRPRGRGPREIHVQGDDGTEWNLVPVNSRRRGGKGGRGKDGRQGNRDGGRPVGDEY